ncbi:hypothetical protein MKX03_001090 [Papaver bracteatum]|nr:hypothetical protein MKX03_001090 [Papaver bracteatum]
MTADEEERSMVLRLGFVKRRKKISLTLSFSSVVALTETVDTHLLLICRELKNKGIQFHESIDNPRTQMFVDSDSYPKLTEQQLSFPKLRSNKSQVYDLDI